MLSKQIDERLNVDVGDRRWDVSVVIKLVVCFLLFFGEEECRLFLLLV